MIRTMFVFIFSFLMNLVYSGLYEDKLKTKKINSCLTKKSISHEKNQEIKINCLDLFNSNLFIRNIHNYIAYNFLI